jgi:hypothetical protein
VTAAARAKLAKNLVKVRAARARNLKAARKKWVAKKSGKNVAKKVGRPAKRRAAKRT